MFTEHRGYYPFTVHEFNLPAGYTCPHARVCKVMVGRESGRFRSRVDKDEGFTCYAAPAERFPGVRERRWSNYRAMLSGEQVVIPQGATHVRIHGSGDFYEQGYFDRWLEVAEAHPGVAMWAFTKSLPMWVARMGEIPSNLTLTASVGGTHDHLIKKHGLRFAVVFGDWQAALRSGMPIDTDDSLAMEEGPSFALLDNNRLSASQRRWVAEQARG